MIMKSDDKQCPERVAIRSLRFTPLALALFGQFAFAGPTITLGEDTTIDYSLTASYTASMRLGSPASEYLRDINYDDSTRNFKKGSLVNNRFNALGEVHLKHRNIGLMVRGSSFYDAAYRSRNDNDSPFTVNKIGGNDSFTGDTRELSGQKNRLLDAFVYGNWALDSERYLSLKLGRHTLAWGESMFWPNISQGQAPMDSTKFNVPGTEAKEGYLPVGQISGSFTLNPAVTLVGFYQYKWEPTQLNPVGDYFGTDFFGPGAEFYRLAPGIISSLPDRTFTAANYAGDVDPSNSGQWGVGARFQLGSDTELGVYHYRYHDRVAQMLFDFTGDTRYSSFTRASESPSVGPNYKLAYFDNIKLTGVSLSTKFGDSIQMGGDLSYRQGAPVLVNTKSVGPAPARGDIFQANANFVYMLGPNRFAQQTTLMGELVYQRIQRVDALTVTGSGGLINETSGQFVYDDPNGPEQTRSSSLLGFGAMFDHPNIFQGWDLTTKAIWSQNIAGSAYNGLGRGEKRLTLGADFKYLGNFTIGLTYVGYLSSPSIRRGRTMSDRDYASLSLKYTF